MSRKANPYDNAIMESFFATLKTECLQNQIPKSRREAKLILFDYIETFYNRYRLHSSLGYQSPLEFEGNFTKPNNWLNNKKPCPRFRRKITPFNRDSGTLRGKRTIFGGRRALRCGLYMAALVAARHNLILRNFYQRLRSNGKPHKVALTAVMRKLLLALNHTLKPTACFVWTQDSY